MSDNDIEKEPIAGLTAASACIRISLCFPSEQLTFRPVFTHQCFPQECLPGWRPMIDAEDEARSIYRSWKEDARQEVGAADDQFHPSFDGCQIAGNPTSRIDIHVKLTPSCSSCEIDIQTMESDDDAKSDEPDSKKAKTVQFEKIENDDDKSEKRMSIDDILKQLSTAVPPISSVRLNGTEFSSPDAPIDKSSNNGDCAYVDFPAIGHLKRKYERNIKETSQEAEFFITLARGSDKRASKYHKSVQKLARWFIETADDVDISGKTDGYEEGGFWSVMYLFRAHCTDDESSNNETPKIRYSLAGYFTLFYFHAPFKKPDPGIVVRICQALILPPYQRAGHATDLMTEVYTHSDDCIDGMQIVEINVEDPAPAFVALRDSFDFNQFMNFLETHNFTSNIEDDGFFTALPDNDGLGFIAAMLNITKRQVEIANEMYKLYELENWKKGAESSLIAEKETQYRLMVKKSLRTRRKEELGACSNKEEMKALLEKWYQETAAHYKKLLSRFEELRTLTSLINSFVEFRAW
jgi:histone acetyltransferase 1